MIEFILGGLVLFIILFIYSCLVVAHRCSEREERNGKG